MKLFFILALLSIDALAVNVKTYIPKNAYSLLPIVYAEQQKYFKEHPLPEYFPALIEQESCISLTHSKCWSPGAKLHTNRELGIGFFQLTKAFNSDGDVRFDVVEELREKHDEELSDLKWETIATRPDLQIIAGILKVKDTWDRFYDVVDPIHRAAFTDAAYNGGVGGTQKERRICGLQENCDPEIWFDNVEKIRNGKSHRRLYGDRSAWDINRKHPRTIFFIRMPKYLVYYKSQTWTMVKPNNVIPAAPVLSIAPAITPIKPIITPITTIKPSTPTESPTASNTPIMVPIAPIIPTTTSSSISPIVPTADSNTTTQWLKAFGLIK